MNGDELIVDEPCAIPDLDEGIYHEDSLCPEPSLSSTMAKTIVRPGGPARVREAMLHREPPKDAFDFGSAAHEKILGRGAGVEIIDAPDWRSKAAREARDAARSDGKTPLLAKDAVQVDAMADAILNNDRAGELFTRGAGNPELSMFAPDPCTGRWQRGRLDFLASRTEIVDFKTSGVPVDADSWTKHSWDYGYHIQAACYLDLAVRLDLVDPDAKFIFIAQEKTAPYLVASYTLSDEALEAGAAQVRKALSIWDRCLTLGDWPGLPISTQTISLPRWAATDDTEDY